MIETQQQQGKHAGYKEHQDTILDEEFKRGQHGRFSADTPPNAPEQSNTGFAVGEADPAKYPEGQEIGRFSTGQDESEPIDRGCFAEGQETEPKAIDPDEGFAEEKRESSPTGA
jgi:hypothetical protein